jgi:hypothetical protein
LNIVRLIFPAKKRRINETQLVRGAAGGYNFAMLVSLLLMIGIILSAAVIIAFALLSVLQSLMS